MSQLFEIHCLNLISETSFVRLLESVILKRNDKSLLVEIYLLKLKRSVTVVPIVCLLITRAVEHLESQIVLGLGHLHLRRIRKSETGVAFASGVIVDHHLVHHLGSVTARLHPENVPLNTVVESSGRNLDFLLGLTDVITKSVDLVVGKRHQVVGCEKRTHTY